MSAGSVTEVAVSRSEDKHSETVMLATQYFTVAMSSTQLFLLLLWKTEERSKGSFQKTSR